MRARAATSASSGAGEAQEQLGPCRLLPGASSCVQPRVGRLRRRWLLRSAWLEVPGGGAGHGRAELLGGDGRRGRRRRPAGRGTSPAGCRTGRSVRPGRRRSAGRRGPRGGPRGSGPRSAPARRRPHRGWGAAAISSLGLWLISRPTISFCWLPPEREAAVTSMPGVRTSYSRTIRAVSSRAAPRLSRPPLVLGCSVTWPRMRFSQSGASSSRPCRCRSSGM